MPRQPQQHAGDASAPDAAVAPPLGATATNIDDATNIANAVITILKQQRHDKKNKKDKKAPKDF